MIFHKFIVRIILLTVLLFFVGCGDSASSSEEEKNPTLYTSVNLGACKDAPSSNSSIEEEAYASLIDPYYSGHFAVYLGDCRHSPPHGSVPIPNPVCGTAYGPI